MASWRAASAGSITERFSPIAPPPVYLAICKSLGGDSEMGMIEELQAAVRKVSDGVGKSVVGVGRAGSGVVVGQGLVATNAHNLREGPVTVTFADGREAEGSVSAVDMDADLAVIAVDTAGWPAVTWAEA